MLEEALDEEVAGLLGKAFEQGLDGGEALVRHELRVHVGFAGRQAPAFVFRMNVYREVVDERSALGRAIFVDRQIAKNLEVESAGVRHRTVVPRDEVEYPHGRSGDEILRTLTAAPGP
jgi:hypothetical protein